MKTSSLILLALLSGAASAYADVAVTSPVNGAELVSPFALNAVATPCSSQPVGAMGYSFDDSPNTTIVYSNTINAQVSASTGAHTLWVKSWGNQGAPCAVAVPIIILPSPVAQVPSNAVSVPAVQSLPTWQAVNDTGTGPGSTTGAMAMLSTPSMSGSARDFSTTFTNYAGERYYATFGADTQASNFLYDGYLYIAGSSAGIANIEMDVNQVMANGQTVIFGFQCDGWSLTWDYTANQGTPQSPSDVWLHSNQPCNPRTWSVNAWHNVQITYSRDQYGNVTYGSVWLDGVEQDINATVPSAFALGWDPTLLTNFQVDGYGTSGSSNVYLDNLTIYRW